MRESKSRVTLSLAAFIRSDSGEKIQSLRADCMDVLSPSQGREYIIKGGSGLRSNITVTQLLEIFGLGCPRKPLPKNSYPLIQNYLRLSLCPV